MAIVTLAEIKDQLNITEETDDTLLTGKIAAAQGHIERLLGFQIEQAYTDGAPAELKEAVFQLASWWYEQREAAIVGSGVTLVPHGVHEIINEYRRWSFSDGE